MGWIDKELKRRTKQALPLTTSLQPPEAPESDRMQDLWARIHSTNGALPAEIRLAKDRSKRFAMSAEEAGIQDWLLAPNGAALGFAGSAIRYSWPEKTQRRSKNFWIRWSAERQCFVINQRLSSTMPPRYSAQAFNENRVDYMLKCLVLAKLVVPRRVRKKRFLLF